jgi:hypothetical protein
MIHHLVIFLSSRIEMSKKYPFVNEDAEKNCDTVSGVMKNLMSLGGISRQKINVFKDLRDFILGEFCLETTNQSWSISDVALKDCYHKAHTLR